MGDPKSVERLAEILWTSRALAVGDDPAGQPFAEVSARLRTQYLRQAEEVAKVLDADRDAETVRLRAELERAEHELVLARSEVTSRTAEHKAALDRMQTAALTARTERDDALTELAVHKAPPDCQNDDHRARLLKVFTDVITELAPRDPKAAARQIMLHAGGAMASVERQQARIAEWALAIAGSVTSQVDGELPSRLLEMAARLREKAQPLAPALAEPLAAHITVLAVRGHDPQYGTNHDWSCPACGDLSQLPERCPAWSLFHLVKVFAEGEDRG